MTQSVIVYRNPLEQWFWEGEGALFCLGFIVSFVIVTWAHGYVSKLWRRWKFKQASKRERQA